MSSRKSLAVFRMLSETSSTHYSRSKIELFSSNSFLHYSFPVSLVMFSQLLKKYSSPSGSLCLLSSAKLLGYPLKRSKQDFGMLQNLLGPLKENIPNNEGLIASWI